MSWAGGRLWAIIRHPAALFLVCVVGAVFAYEAENASETLPFSIALAATVICLLFLVSARAAFSVYAGWSLVILVTVISAVKFKMKGFSLHYYDAVFFAGDPEVYRFLVSSYLHLIAPVLVMLLAAAGAAGFLFRKDSRTNWRMPTRLAMVAACGLALTSTYPSEASKGRFFYYMQGRHLSAAFVSLLDLGNLFVPNELEKRLAHLGSQAPTPAASGCGDGAKLPDIYFVLSESVADPAIFPQVAGGEGFLQRHSPGAGRPQPMNVETFGGGTWITNLSLLAGLSATDFGWRSPYLTMTLENKIGGSLPQMLAQCGYRTAALLPLDYTFVNEGPFLKSIGFETVLDINDIGASFYHLRDDFYYRAAQAFIEKHRREDGRPLFLEIQTMFPHSPYLERLEPGIAVEGEPLHSNPEVAEYLRRVAIARQDFQGFLDQRRADTMPRGSVVFEFGDHHSFVTKPFVDDLAGADALGNMNSLAYRTYFTLTSFGHPAREQLAPFPIDVGFVGVSFLDAIGLPLSPMMSDLLALRDHCQGRFHACEDREAVDRHLRARLDAGLLKLLPAAPRSAPAVAHLQ